MAEGINEEVRPGVKRSPVLGSHPMSCLAVTFTTLKINSQRHSFPYSLVCGMPKINYFMTARLTIENNIFKERPLKKDKEKMIGHGRCIERNPGCNLGTRTCLYKNRLILGYLSTAVESMMSCIFLSIPCSFSFMSSSFLRFRRLIDRQTNIIISQLFSLISFIFFFYEIPFCNSRFLETFRHFFDLFLIYSWVITSCWRLILVIFAFLILFRSWRIPEAKKFL